MSVLIKNSLTWFQSLVLKILKTGKVPKHVAIIMDGNRRYAKRQGIEKAEGHKQGFNKLAETMSWMLQMGIPQLTVYAFSIYNFKRTDEEVRAIMDLAKEKFQKLLDEKDHLMENGIRVKVVGNFSMVPPDLREVIYNVISSTKYNDKACLTVALCYASRDEITITVKDVVKRLKAGDISIDDLDENVFTKCLYTYESSPIDLLIRTSGEVRLSDFMLWQSSSACIYFTKVLWPDFSVWDFISSIFYYQRCYNDIIKIRKDCLEEDQKPGSNKILSFIENLQEEREAVLANH